MGKTFYKNEDGQLNVSRQEDFNVVMRDLTLTEYRIWMNLCFELKGKKSITLSDTIGAEVCGIERSQYAKGIKGLVEKEYIVLAEDGTYCVKGISGLNVVKEKEPSEFNTYRQEVDDEMFAQDSRVVLKSMPFGKWMEEASIPLVEYLIAITKKTREDFEREKTRRNHERTWNDSAKHCVWNSDRG